jgi:hypothetical protein
MHSVIKWERNACYGVMTDERLTVCDKMFEK